MEIDTSRLKVEDWLALCSGLVLSGSIFLSWYKLNGSRVSGWDATGLTVIILVVGLLMLLVEISIAYGVVFPRSEGFLLVFGGLLVLAVVIARLFIKQSSLTVDYGMFIALGAGVAITGAGLVKLVRSYIL